MSAFAAAAISSFFKGHPAKCMWQKIAGFSTLTPETRVGLVGLGNVGSAIARNILSSDMNLHAVFDTKPQAMQGLDSKITRAENARELAEECQVIVTALPTPASVKKAMESDNGIFAGIKKDSVWIDHSTTDYQQTLNFAARCKELGVDFLEAPVTGGMALLKQGLMTVLVSGDKRLYEECLPLLKMSGETVLYLGGLGTATITKVISNMLAATHNVAMGEALMLAKKNNIDLKMFFDAIRYSAGNSYVIETEAPLVFNGTFDPEFSLGLHCKDLALGRAIASNSGVPIRLHDLVEEIYNEARVRYGDDAGSSHPPKLLQDDLNVRLQIEGFEDWTYSINVVDDTIAVRHTTKNEDN
eukprot:gene20411-22424_t